jgi:tRNA pseudouridine32 synthase / 23S rRNA pseudouridine746 synthase
MRSNRKPPRQTLATAPVPVLLLAPALMVIDKPAGLAVHPGPRTPDSLEPMLEHLRFGYTEAPVPMHRLDRDTSGCLLLARRRSANRRLSALFESRRIGKTYWAITDGIPSELSGVVDAPLRKISEKATGWRMIVDPAGQSARTHWRVLGQSDGRAWLELTPETGRTHQLRVHCAELGCPIAGDPVYGRSPGPMLLHARSLTIPWEEGATPIVVEAQPPATFLAAIPAA